MGIVGAIAVPHPPLIVPAVGQGQEAQIQDTIDAYRQATAWLMERKPDCLVITSPHAPLFRDAFHVTTDEVLFGSMARFNAPHERIEAPCDVELARHIVRQANQEGILAVDSTQYGDDMDHATYVPLHFVREWQREAQGVQGADGALDVPCPIVRIGLSGLSPNTHRQLGRVISRVAASLGRSVGFIASGDLAHRLLAEGPYGFTPEAPVFDERVCQAFASGDLEDLFDFDEAFCEAAGECGLRSFQIMVGALDGLKVETELLAHEGTFGVGYGVAVCRVDDHAADSASLPSTCVDEAIQEDFPVLLARLSVETFVKTGNSASLPANVPSELSNDRAGVFVSLHEHGELRGCIGTIAPTCNSVAEEILRNGICACSEDPRFPPVQASELDYLEYSVDILTAPQHIDSQSALDPRRFGVIVSQGWKRGLLLPNLDGVDTVDQQVAIAKMKAGIDPADMDVELQRFEVVRYTRGGEPRK